MVTALPTHPPHRPWPLPTGRWLVSQRWSDLLFAHWPVPRDALRPLVPEGLEIDTFEGQAWIAAVPFRMEAARPRWLPALPWLSTFPELNLRTYVKLPAAEGRESYPGVFFFSLDAASPVAVALGRRGFHLPYLRARMTCERQGGRGSETAGEIRYRSTRTHPRTPSARFEGRYGPAGEVFHARPGTLEHFLTERYCLYASPGSVGRPGDGVFRAEVHHDPWPLQPARATLTVNSLFQGLPDGSSLDDAIEGPALEPPHLLFARGIDVLGWPLRRV